MFSQQKKEETLVDHGLSGTNLRWKYRVSMLQDQSFAIRITLKEKGFLKPALERSEIFVDKARQPIVKTVRQELDRILWSRSLDQHVLENYPSERP